jgi:Ca-activated chloride channel family protein
MVGGSVLRFGSPAALLLGAALPLYGALRLGKVLVPRAVSVTLGDWGGEGFRFAPRDQWLPALALLSSRILLGAAFLGGVLVLGDPLWVAEQRVYLDRGAEVTFVVDTSPSMAARDLGGKSRLNAAREAASRLVREQAGTAYGLVALGSEAALVTPPTGDHGLFTASLEGLVIGGLGEGSALGSGIAVALYHSLSSSAPRRTIVLLTDGENNAGVIHPARAARMCYDEGIPVYVLGIGTRGTVPLHYQNPVSGEQYSGYLDSRFDEGTLEAIAVSGGGAYYPALSVAGLKAALDSVAAEAAVHQAWQDEGVTQSLGGLFLAASLTAAALAWLIRRLYLREAL